MPDEPPAQVEIQIDYPVAQIDLFHRDQPADREGDPHLWAVVRDVISFGSALLQGAPPPDPSSRPRDLILIALLRRALVTAEGVDTLLRRGLYEPAFALFRTLLDIELNLKLVAQDPTDTMARRLAAYHYLRYQRHGQRIAATPEARERRKSGHGLNPVAVARSYAAFLDSPMFDDIREAVRSSQHWHGLKNVEDAFVKVGSRDDYIVLYDLGSYFAHASNPEWDFADADGTHVRMRALVERNPAPNAMSQKNLAIRLLAIVQLYVDQRGLPDTLRQPPGPVEATAPTVAAHRVSVDALKGLYFHVAGRLGFDADALASAVAAEAAATSPARPVEPGEAY
jgi:hypothetical protein